MPAGEREGRARDRDRGVAYEVMMAAMTQPILPFAATSLAASAANGPASLNRAQREAEAHGPGAAVPAGPLLVIAGAARARPPRRIASRA